MFWLNWFEGETGDPTAESPSQPSSAGPNTSFANLPLCTAPIKLSGSGGRWTKKQIVQLTASSRLPHPLAQKVRLGTIIFD